MFNLSPLLLYIFQIGPLRCWPGGLCLSRSIGDMDVGEFIVPIPYVKQVKVASVNFCSIIILYIAVRFEKISDFFVMFK